MRILITFVLAIGLFGCSESDPADQAPDETNLASEPTAAPTLALSEPDLIRVCKAGQHHTVGTPLDDMRMSVSTEDTVRISYTRDDGKSFRYDCRVTGNVIQTRMIDEAGPGTGPGMWSGRGSTVTYQLEPDVVILTSQFSDGSSDSERVKI